MSENTNRGEKPAAEFGASLRQVREGLDISLRKAAEAAGFSAAYLSQMEMGNIRDPSPRVLYDLAKVYAAKRSEEVDDVYARFLHKAGYKVPHWPPEQAAPSGAIAERYQAIATHTLNFWLSLTQEERDSLVEYLDWYRWRHRRGRGSDGTAVGKIISAYVPDPPENNANRSV